MAISEETFYDMQQLRIQRELSCNKQQAHTVYGQAYMLVEGDLTKVEETITNLIEFLKEYRSPSWSSN